MDPNREPKTVPETPKAPEKKEQRKEPKYARGAKPKVHWFNVFDILVILLIIGAVLVGVFRNNIFNLIRTGPDAKDETISYVLEFKNVDSSYKNAIAAGSKLYLVGDTLSLGTVSRVESVENSYEIVYTQEGARKEYYPNNTYVDITIVVSADVKSQERGYFIDDVRIAIGASYEVKTDSFTGQAVCIGFGE